MTSAMDGKYSAIELDIEELVLDGFPASHRHFIRAAVERELTRLFAERGVPPTWNSDQAIPRLQGGSIALRPGTPPSAVGRQIAGALYQSMGAGEERPR
jgi:hypothetical protein